MNIISLFYRAVRRYLDRILLNWHRQRLLKCVNGGKGLHLEGKIMLIYGENLTLGEHIHIGKDAYINCKGGVTIGDYSVLSRGVTIYSYDHNFKNPRCLPYDDDVVLKPVHIGRYVWIGMNVTITPGTKIGDGAVIGMGTVISGEVPENAVVVNDKPRIIGYRDAEHTKTLVNGRQFYEPN